MTGARLLPWPKRPGRAGRALPGAPKVRIATPAASAGERLQQISVIEIVNDDMPFLLDSVMGELAERGVEVRLVVHPVFTVGPRRLRPADRL